MKEDIMDLKEIVDLCKSGRASEAYAESIRLMTADAANRYSRLAMAYSIKALMEKAAKEGDEAEVIRLMEEFGNLRLEEIDETEMNNQLAWPVRALILNWMDNGGYTAEKANALFETLRGISFAKPHRYYSILLASFLRLRDSNDQPWEGLPEFVSWWGLEYLLPEDYEKRLMNNGIRVLSLAEQAYTATLKALSAAVGKGEQMDAAESFIGDMEVLEETHPEYHNIIYQKSMLLKAMGRMGEALQSARSFARKRPTEFRAWSALGDVVDDNNEKMGCYSRALLCKVDPMFQGKVRYKLAVTMYNAGEYSHAKREFEKIIRTYEQKGWHLPAGVEPITRQQWYISTFPAESNRAFYNQHAREAEAMLVTDVPVTPVLISSVNPQKGIAVYVTPDHRRGYFSMKRLGCKIMNHNIYNVRFDGEPQEGKASKVLDCRPAEDVKSYEGTLYRKVHTEVGLRPGQSFLFAENIYIDGTLLRGIPAGTPAEVTAVLYYNIKKEDWGWRAVRVVPDMR